MPAGCQALAALVLGLAGCTSDPTGDWHGDKRFTPDERAAIEVGVNWLAYQSRTPAPRIVWDYEVTSPQAMPHTIRRERGAYGEHGATGLCHQGSTVYIDVNDPGMQRSYLPGLAAHEFGHCLLGMKDDPDSSGIMHNVRAMAWTEREERQVGR